MQNLRSLPRSSDVNLKWPVSSEGQRVARWQAAWRGQPGSWRLRARPEPACEALGPRATRPG